MANGIGNVALAGMAGSSLLGGLGGLFGGTDYGEDINRAMGYYQQGMREAERALTERETVGREDIQSALREAQLYGEPYREAGTTALQSYLGSLGLGGSPAQQAARQAFQVSPGYQFALEQGLKGIRRGLSATGLRGSGAEQKELLRYGQGLAAQEYGDWQDQLRQLAGLGAETGEMAAQRQYGTGGLLANLGLGYGGQLSQLYGTMAQAQAESELAKAQIAAQQRAAQQQALGSTGLAGGLLGMFL